MTQRLPSSPDRVLGRPIRICHVASGDLWAGAEAQISVLLAALSAHETVRLSVVLLNRGRLADAVNSLGLRLLVLDESKSSFPRLRKQLARFLLSYPADILHSHRAKENLLGASVKRVAGLSGLVCTVHGLVEFHSGIKRLKSSLVSGLNHLVLKHSFDRIVSVSREMKRQLEPSFPGEKLVTVHNAVDLSRIRTTREPTQVRAEFGISPQVPVVVTAGRLVGVKGHQVLISAMGVVVEKIPNAHLLICGDGPLRESLKEEANRLGLGGRVRVLGFRGDVHEILKSADLFVMSSFSEGLPMALLEAMALGVPVIATEVGGISEVIVGPEHGILVPPGNVEQLADEIVATLRDPEKREVLSSAGKKRVRGAFSSENLGRQMLSLYEGILSSTEDQVIDSYHQW